MNTTLPDQVGLLWFEVFALNALIAVVILVAGWWASLYLGRMVKSLVQRSHSIDPTVVPMARSVTIWTVRILVLTAVLARFGVQTASIIALLGAAGLAVGLALQNTLQNIAAGIMLLVLRPLRAGEFVSVVGKGDGTVDEVGLFLTRFVQSDGVQFTLPNSSIWGNPIINYSRNRTRRLDLAIGIRYGDDLEVAIECLRTLLAQHERVLDDPAPSVFVTEYRDSIIMVNMRAWAESSVFWDVRAELLRDAPKELAQAGFKLPVPVREVQQIEAKGANLNS